MSEEKLTLKEAAAELRVTPRTLREMCAAGRIGFTRLGRRHWLFTQADIDAFIQRNSYRPKPVYGKSKN
jgi:excisionase family DNA binding protein